MTNYDKYAKAYFKLWKDFDSDACVVFSSNWRGQLKDREKRALRALQKYCIARNFKKGGTRLARFFDMIDAVRNLKRSTNPVDAVERVRKGIKNLYGVPTSKRFFVHASKILWFKFGGKLDSPIAICDSRAMNWFEIEEKERCYATFYPLWLARFKKEEAAISKACEKLAQQCPDPAHKRIISKPWFRERVFDRRLWVEGKKKGK